MSRVTTCQRCGGRVVLPAFPGDGVYEPPHHCDLEARDEWMRALRDDCGTESDYDLGLDGRPKSVRA